jgi:hypothetical protein
VRETVRCVCVCVCVCVEEEFMGVCALEGVCIGVCTVCVCVCVCRRRIFTLHTQSIERLTKDPLDAPRGVR